MAQAEGYLGRNHGFRSSIRNQIIRLCEIRSDIAHANIPEGEAVEEKIGAFDVGFEVVKRTLFKCLGEESPSPDQQPKPLQNSSWTTQEEEGP